MAPQRLALRPADRGEQTVLVASPRLPGVANCHLRRVRRRGRDGVVDLAIVVRKRPHGRAGAMAEQDEHAGDVRRRSSIALALAAGGHKAEAGSHCRSRSRVPSAKSAQHGRSGHHV